MKGIIIPTRKLPFNYTALTIFPFVFAKGLVPEWLKNHERIHLQQQLELLILPFYVWYLLEFCIRFLQFGSRELAYRAISFEREAYENHGKEDYLQSRKRWQFVAYIKKKGI
jgi:hypothetical protein